MDLLFLSEGKLKTVLYSESQEFPPVANFSFKASKFKCVFKADNIQKENVYSWIIGNKTLLNPEINFDFKKPGTYSVSLLVTMPNGLKDKITKTIKI